MESISCPHCNKQGLSPRAPMCPECGEPLQQVTATRSTHMRNCPDCGGHGESRRDCTDCNGSGTVTCTRCEAKGYTNEYDHFSSPPHAYREPCTECAGNGRYPCTRCPFVCDTCGGSGDLTVEQYDELMVQRAEQKRIQDEAYREKQRQWEADAPKRAAEQAQSTEQSAKAREDYDRKQKIDKKRQAWESSQVLDLLMYVPALIAGVVVFYVTVLLGLLLQTLTRVQNVFVPGGAFIGLIAGICSVKPAQERMKEILIERIFER